MNERSVESLLGAAAIARLARPIESAVGLPGRAYTDPAFHQLEQDSLFPQTWVGVGFAEELPSVGDAVPVTVGGKPVVLVRGEDGSIRAFHNVCRHRAIIVVQKPEKRLANLQCPYHAWTYGLDGALKATPYWDGTPGGSTGIDRSQHGLVPVQADVFNHVVFVNLDGTAGPLENYLAPAIGSLGSVDLESWQLAYRVTWEFRANWKLVLENWENYHHVWVHEGIFTKMTEEVNPATGECYTESVPDGNVLVLRRKSGAPTRSAAAPLSSATRLPQIPGRNGAAAFTGQTTAVLPNVTMTMGPAVYAPVVYMPLGPDRTRASMAWYFAGTAATDPTFADLRESTLDRWVGATRRMEDGAGVRAQDFRCLELQQIARASPAADLTRFSPLWEPNVYHFQNWVVRRLAG
jgi:choline monooxygenase